MISNKVIIKEIFMKYKIIFIALLMSINHLSAGDCVKRVSFAEGTKKHDGLSAINSTYEELTTNLLNGKIKKTKDLKDIINKYYPDINKEEKDKIKARLSEKLLDFAKRLKDNAGVKQTSILNDGGGECIKIEDTNGQWARYIENSFIPFINNIEF